MRNKKYRIIQLTAETEAHAFSYYHMPSIWLFFLICCYCRRNLSATGACILLCCHCYFSLLLFCIFVSIYFSRKHFSSYLAYFRILYCFFAFLFLFIFQEMILVLIRYKCKKLNSLKHLVRTTVAGSHN